jgi:hypothetical protein
MAAEAVIVELLGNAGDPIRYTCATTMAKGTIVKITDPRTIAASTAADEPIAGVLAHETTTGVDTTAAVYTNGLFSMTDVNAGGCAIGKIVAIGGANLIDEADANDLLQGSTVGQAMEALAGGTSGVIRVLK